jgi:hypothetical protein
MMGKWGNLAFACGNPIKHHSCPGTGTIFWSISYRIFLMERIEILSAPSSDNCLKASLLHISSGMRHAVSWYDIMGHESRQVSDVSHYRLRTHHHFIGRRDHHPACSCIRAPARWAIRKWWSRGCGQRASGQSLQDDKLSGCFNPIR